MTKQDKINSIKILLPVMRKMFEEEIEQLEILKMRRQQFIKEIDNYMDAL